MECKTKGLLNSTERTDIQRILFGGSSGNALLANGNARSNRCRKSSNSEYLDYAMSMSNRRG